jgi:hypothetical protein
MNLKFSSPVLEANFIVLVGGKHNTVGVLAIVPASKAIMRDCIVILVCFFSLYNSPVWFGALVV